MNLPAYFVSIDWGTTNFRLRVVDTNSLNIILEHKTHDGVKAVFEKYKQQNKATQSQFFGHYLHQQISVLPNSYQSYPIVISGMASSTIGLKELAYSDFPFGQHGNSIYCEQLVLPDGKKTLLISGVKSETGMMRGEETQAIGLGDHLMPHKEGVLLLPGTHSKHLTYENGQFTKLANFMTGELFEILSRRSILSNSVTSAPFSKKRAASFKKGLSLGIAKQLSTSLLLIRADDVIRHIAKEDNFYFLSGLLIGDELSYLKGQNGKIFLAAPYPIFNLYRLALEHLFCNDRLAFFDAPLIEGALLKGQKKILVTHGK